MASVQSVHAATITVNSTADPTESGKITLRDALAAASDSDTINFSVTTPATITLTTGELLVNKSVTISGPGADQLSVNGNAASRVFHISSGKTVTISGLTITNGLDVTSGGGGIYNDHTTLTVSNCTVSNNSATNYGGGGGIYNDGTLFGGATLTINNSTISGNSAVTGGNGGAGGGILTDGTGGGRATLTINNSTISGNSAASGNGGGIFNATLGTLIVNNSTLSGNSAFNGGGIENYAATLTIGSTILNAGASGANIVNLAGTVTSLGYNLSSDDASAFLNQSTDQNSTDPMLGPLQNNGGPTLTQLPSSNSPAVGAGHPIDQRGAGFGIPITVGAVQVQPTPTPTPTGVPAAPIATAATHVTNNSFTANWTSVSGATGYRLDIATTSSFNGSSYINGYHNSNVGNVTSVNVTGLSANTAYYYRVRAYNSFGTGPKSNVITAATSP